MQNLESTIISQYANSPILLQLLTDYNEYLDPTADFDNFYNIVWNVDTAVGFGLDIWGRIVNVPRQIRLTTSETKFGFNDGLQDYAPFGQAPFNSINLKSSGTYELSDDAYRVLILTKALSNISRATVPAMNKLLQNMFQGRGRCYVNNLFNMQIRFTFEFYLHPYEFAILTQTKVLPVPTGVESYLLQIATPGTFGFNTGTDDFAPFGQGTFLSQGAQVVIN